MRDSWETHGHLVEKTRRHPRRRAQSIEGLATTRWQKNSVCWEHEGIISELHGRECLCVQHQLERFDPITCRRGDTGGGGGRGRPYPYPSHDHSCSKGKQANLAHLKSPFI